MVVGKVTAVKFCKGWRRHIRDMNIANLGVRFFMDDAAVVLDPFAITCRSFIPYGFCGDYAYLFAGRILDSELYFITCLVHQQFLWAALRPHTLPIDCEYGITRRNI